jgi:hypothetical protein
MPTVMIVLNVIFAIGVVGAIVGAQLYAVLTQQHDHGVLASGPALRRQIWSRGGRPHAGSRRVPFARRAQAFPAA